MYITSIIQHRIVYISSSFSYILFAYFFSNRTEEKHKVRMYKNVSLNERKLYKCVFFLLSSCSSFNGDNTFFMLQNCLASFAMLFLFNIFFFWISVWFLFYFSIYCFSKQKKRKNYTFFCAVSYAMKICHFSFNIISWCIKFQRFVVIHPVWKIYNRAS